MKKGINFWSFAPNTSVKDAMELCKRAGYEAIELTMAEEGEINLDSSQEEIKKILGYARNVGVEIASLATSLMWKYPLSSSDPVVREKAKSIVKKSLEVASWLEVEAVLVVPGVVESLSPDDEVVAYDVVYERSLNALRELAQVAESKRVTIGIENVWNKFLLSPTEMRDFIDQIVSDYVGCYFDVGNILPIGLPEQWIRILGSRIKRVHFKDFKLSVGNINGFVDLLAGDVNWPEVMVALKEVGYDGYVTAEMSPYKSHPEAILWNTSKSMDFILARV